VVADHLSRHLPHMHAGASAVVAGHLAYAMAGRALDIVDSGGDIWDPQAWCASDLQQLWRAGAVEGITREPCSVCGAARAGLEGTGRRMPVPVRVPAKGKMPVQYRSYLGFLSDTLIYWGKGYLAWYEGCMHMHVTQSYTSHTTMDALQQVAPTRIKIMCRYCEPVG
jgi:hypothetical protein